MLATSPRRGRTTALALAVGTAVSVVAATLVPLTSASAEPGPLPDRWEVVGQPWTDNHAESVPLLQVADAGPTGTVLSMVVRDQQTPPRPTESARLRVAILPPAPAGAPSWTAPVTDEDVYWSRVAADPVTGDGAVMYGGDAGPMLWTYDASAGQWVAPRPVAGDDHSGYARMPELAVSNGQVHVLAAEKPQGDPAELIAYTAAVDGGDVDRALLESSEHLPLDLPFVEYPDDEEVLITRRTGPRLETAPDGSVHATWVHLGSEQPTLDGPRHLEVRVSQADDSPTGWTAPTTLGAPRLAMGQSVDLLRDHDRLLAVVQTYEVTDPGTPEAHHQDRVVEHRTETVPLTASGAGDVTRVDGDPELRRPYQSTQRTSALTVRGEPDVLHVMDDDAPSGLVATTLPTWRGRVTGLDTSGRTWATGSCNEVDAALCAWRWDADAEAWVDEGGLPDLDLDSEIGHNAFVRDSGSPTGVAVFGSSWVDDSHFLSPVLARRVPLAVSTPPPAPTGTWGVDTTSALTSSSDEFRRVHWTADAGPSGTVVSAVRSLPAAGDAAPVEELQLGFLPADLSDDISWTSPRPGRQAFASVVAGDPSTGDAGVVFYEADGDDPEDWTTRVTTYSAQDATWHDAGVLPGGELREPPRIAMSGGALHVLAIRSADDVDHLEVHRFPADGSASSVHELATWPSAEHPLTDYLDGNGGAARGGPQLAVAPDGSVHAAWVAPDLPEWSDHHDTLAARTGPDGLAWSAVDEVLPASVSDGGDVQLIHGDDALVLVVQSDDSWLGRHVRTAVLTAEGAGPFAEVPGAPILMPTGDATSHRVALDEWTAGADRGPWVVDLDAPGRLRRAALPDGVRTFGESIVSVGRDRDGFLHTIAVDDADDEPHDYRWHAASRTWVDLGAMPVSPWVGGGYPVGSMPHLTFLPDAGSPAGMAVVVVKGVFQGDPEDRLVRFLTEHTGTTTPTDTSTPSVTGSTTATAPALLAPLAPAVSATPGKASMRVSWSAPAADAGRAAVTGYEVVHGATGVEPTSRVVSAGTRSLRIGGLVNGATYDVVVRALSATGPSPWSVRSRAMPVGRPSAVTKLRVRTKKNGDVVVRWGRGAKNGGRPVTGYTVRVNGGKVRVIDGRTTSRWVHKAARDGRTYRYTVRAANDVAASKARTVKRRA